MTGDGTNRFAETRERAGYLRTWVLIRFRPPYGVDVWPVRAESEAALPEPADIIALHHSTFAPERGEYTEWRGPFKVKV